MLSQRGKNDRIFHLALPDDWAETVRSGTYTVSTRGRSLDEEGFIHCSTLEQVEPTANNFYADLDQVVVLAIDVKSVDSEIKWEPPAPGSDQLFPHIYGPLKFDAIAQSTIWFRPGESWSLEQLDP